jgi:esterase/lipase superfamily enzyme
LSYFFEILNSINKNLLRLTKILASLYTSKSKYDRLDSNMLFVTNHPKLDGSESKFGEKYKFDLKNREIGQSMYFCKTDADGETYTEIGSEKLLTELRDSKEYSEVLIYFHGFNVQPKAAIRHALVMQDILDKKASVSKQTRRFKVVPFIWPSHDKTGIYRDYFDDKDSANASGIAFARVMARFMEWQAKNHEQSIECLKRINIMAHSMGGRVLRNSMSYWSQNFGNTVNVPYLFRNVFMVAADVANHTLEEGKKGHILTKAARNIVVYYAHDDNALRGSKVANATRGVLTRRIGHTGPEDFLRNRKIPTNVFAIDCSDINTIYDNPLGHTYFMTNSVGEANELFEHMCASLNTGRVEADEDRTHRIPYIRYDDDITIA